MQSTRDLLLYSDFPALRRGPLATLQVNLGYTCNQSCSHCHVNAGPSRTEQMSRETMDQVLEVLVKRRVPVLDVTGGAPEMNPHFRYLVGAAREAGIEVIDRCNLTILLEPGYQWLLPFLAEQGVTVVASLPCYSEDNVSTQRGKGIFDTSIKALQALNSAGYGAGDLQLNLVYNPVGPFLPPPQQALEDDYRRVLGENYGIVFDNLYTITNMPISRFGAVLLAQGQFDGYIELLKNAYSSGNLQTVMCHSTVSVDWQGRLYDCDFNQMLELPLAGADDAVIARSGGAVHIGEMLSTDLEGRPIVTGDHCYGCTAGQGSSCGGALN